MHLSSGFQLFHFTNRQNKSFYKCDSDEYFDGGNFQGFQSERAFSAHELIADCPAPQFGYRRYRARITEISSDIKLPLYPQSCYPLSGSIVFFSKIISWRDDRSISVLPAPHFNEWTADERSEFPLIELLTVNTSRIYRVRIITLLFSWSRFTLFYLTLS